MKERIKDIALEVIVENISAPAWVFNDAEFDEFSKQVVGEVIQECVNIIRKEYYLENDKTIEGLDARSVAIHDGTTYGIGRCVNQLVEFKYRMG